MEKEFVKRQSCSFFGHRKISLNVEQVKNLERLIEELIVKYNVQYFLFGSRSEFDALCHKIVSQLKKKYPHIIRISYTSGSESCLLEIERKIVEALKIKESIEMAEELEEKYMSAVSSLGLRDKAMVLDCYLNGMPYWKIGMEYGFSEEGARKHLDRLIKKIAEKIK